MPPPLDRLVAAINAGDFEGFIALFAPDGVVDDWGRRFKGPAAIRKWSDKELIGAHGTLTVSQVIRKRGRIAFHDIIPHETACFGVPEFWDEIRAGHETIEICDAESRERRSGFGIGVVFWQASAPAEV